MTTNSIRASYIYHLAIAAGLVSAEGYVSMTAPVAHFLADVAIGAPVDLASGEAFWAVSWGHVVVIGDTVRLASYFDAACAKVHAELAELTPVSVAA